MRSLFSIGIILLVASAASITKAETWSCLNDVDGVEAFASGDMKRAPNYTENSAGGVRVQREHPQTYMFGQAKFIQGKNSSGAICQYTNHVGWVATYVIIGAQTTNSIESCVSGACKLEPHWRSEWTNSEPGDKERIHVCVKTVDGLDKPSTGCTFEGE